VLLQAHDVFPVDETSVSQPSAAKEVAMLQDKVDAAADEVVPDDHDDRGWTKVGDCASPETNRKGQPKGNYSEESNDCHSAQSMNGMFEALSFCAATAFPVRESAIALPALSDDEEENREAGGEGVEAHPEPEEWLEEWDLLLAEVPFSPLPCDPCLNHVMRAHVHAHRIGLRDLCVCLQVEEMGFANRSANCGAIREHQGNFVKTVKALIGAERSGLPVVNSQPVPKAPKK